MELFVSGYNGFAQWPLQDNIIKNFQRIDLNSFFQLNEEVKSLKYSINWCHNSFIINGKMYLSGLIDKKHKNNFKLVTHPDNKSFTNAVSCDDKCVLLYNESEMAIWKYDLFNVDQSWQKLPNFFSVESDTKMDVETEDIPIESTLRILKIACGVRMNLCLLSDGRLFNIPSEVSTENVEGRIVDVQCGYEHVVLLTDQGKVYTWGGGSRCQLGHGNLEETDQPTIVEALAGIDIVKIAAGGWHTCAISTFGDLYTWGWNDCGQLGIYASKQTANSDEKNNDYNSVLYESVFNDNEFFDPSAFEASCSLKRRKSEESISNKKTKTSCDINESCNSYAIPHLIDIYDDSNDKVLEYNIVEVACGSKHTVIVLDDGTVLGSGCNKYSQLGFDPDFKKVIRIFEPLNMRLSNNAVLKCGDWTTTFLQINDSKNDL